MLYGHLSAFDSYQFLLDRPAWKLAFEWLKNVTPATPAGIQKLQGDQIYANVHGYDTLPGDRCRYENHRRYADLQYCITGGELIDWQLASALLPDGAYNTEKDLQFYLPRPTQTALQMAAGSFAIFFPSDAHAPKHTDGAHKSVSKLVIKLDLQLVS